MTVTLAAALLAVVSPPAAADGPARADSFPVRLTSSSDQPQIDFTCAKPGYFADIANGSKIFHICGPNGTHAVFFCPDGTRHDGALLSSADGRAHSGPGQRPAVSRRAAVTGRGAVTAAEPGRYPAMDSLRALALDLTNRTTQALTEISHLCVDTGTTFTVTDLARRVEDNLPDDYPAPTTGTATRGDLIARIATGILNGDVFGDVFEVCPARPRVAPKPATRTTPNAAAGQPTPIYCHKVNLVASCSHD
ncbi:hypothetical protein [Streptomyces violascens]|uniref:hypothetical protein n=1 Tax=Streptomyces violascens TaxID=67381 RepID=UPI00364B0808